MTRHKMFAVLIVLAALPAFLFAQQAADQQGPPSGAGAAQDQLNRKFSDLVKTNAQDQSGDLRVDIHDVVFTNDGRITHLVVSLAGNVQDQRQAPVGQTQNDGTQAGQAEAPGYGTNPSAADQTAAGTGGDNRYLVPVDRFTFGTAEQAIVVKLSRQELQGLPTLQNGLLPADLGQAGGQAQHLLASSVKDYKVFSRENQNLGGVNDLMLDLKGQKVAYIALAAGGVLGIGEKLYAVPLSAVSRLDTDQKTVVVDISETQLKANPGFDPGNWPAEAAQWTPQAQQPQQ